jgi:CubicO group peptidase (beta-lactamase class C family)
MQNLPEEPRSLVQQYVDDLAALGRLRGVALVVPSGDEAEEGGACAPYTVETRLPIGSVSKVFTAALACALIDEGRLDPAAPVGALLPELGPERGAALTAHHLLSHTGGIASVLRPHGAAALALQAAGPQDDLLRRICAQPPRFPPGARFEYSNSGYTLLAALLARVGGAPFPQLLQERVLRPAGLSHTAPAEDGAGLPAQLRWLRGAGDLVSTARDLGRLGRALLDGRIAEGALARMGTVTAPARAYGYGLRVASRAGRGVLYHDGALPGIVATLHLLPGPGLVVVLLGAGISPGQEGFAVAQLNRWADALTTGRLGGRADWPPWRRACDEAGRSDSARWVGTYALDGGPGPGRGRRVQVLLRDGALRVRAEGDPPFTLPGLASPPGAMAARAVAFLEALAAGREGDAFALCSESAQKESDPAALRAAWQGITGRTGPLSRAVALQEGEGVAFVRCALALAALDAWVIFDEAGAVAAFHMQPPGSGPAAVELPLIPLQGDEADAAGFCADGYPIGAPDVLLTLRRGDPDTLSIHGQEEHVARRVALP